MKTCILTLLFLFSFEVMNAQSIGELKLKTNMSYGEKKFKNNNGKIYVHSFIVNYQIMFEAEKNKAATSTFGGGYKGAQHAAVVTTLEGVEASLLNKMTDQLFAEFKAKLEAKGFEVIDAGDIPMPSSLEKYELVKGGRISDEGIPGCLSVTPSQIDFYEKERLLDMQLVDKAPAISKDLDDAIIAQVTLNVPYLNIGSSGLGLGESQVKVKTNLRVAQQLTGSMKKEEKLLRIGKNDVVTVDSKVSFVMGKRGLAAEALYYGYLGKDLTIEGVMDNQTIKAVSRTTSLGTQVHTAGSLVFYSYQNESHIEIKNLEVDADKYEKGVNKGLSAVLMAHTDGFLNSY